MRRKAPFGAGKSTISHLNSGHKELTRERPQKCPRRQRFRKSVEPSRGAQNIDEQLWTLKIFYFKSFLNTIHAASSKQLGCGLEASRVSEWCWDISSLARRF